MSRLADTRYGNPWWSEFRECLNAWIALDGARSLCTRFEIKYERTLDKWRLGVTTPSAQLATEIKSWMTATVRWAK